MDPLGLKHCSDIDYMRPPPEKKEYKNEFDACKCIIQVCHVDSYVFCAGCFGNPWQI